MSNLPRRFGPNLTYHVKSRCDHLANLMEDAAVKKMFLEVMKQTKKRYNFKLINYIIMDNHFHFIIRTVEGGAPISRIMQFAKARMAERYNRATGHIGSFWNERYTDVIVEEQDNPTLYLFRLLWHMAYNPVREGKCSDPRDYPWSSLPSYLGKEVYAPVQVEHHHYFEELGDSPVERIRKFIFYEDAYRKRYAW